MEKLNLCPFEKCENCVNRFIKKGEITNLCYALSDTNFFNPDGSKRECTFYKTKEMLEEQEQFYEANKEIIEKCTKRVNEICDEWNKKDELERAANSTKGKKH